MVIPHEPIPRRAADHWFAGLARMVIFGDPVPDCHEFILRSASLDCDGGHLWQGRGAELETMQAQDCQGNNCTETADKEERIRFS